VPETLFQGVKSSDYEADHCHLLPRLRMCGYVSPVLLYGLMACTKTNLAFYLGMRVLTGWRYCFDL
jgi:hypothetical protein